MPVDPTGHGEQRPSDVRPVAFELPAVFKRERLQAANLREERWLGRNRLEQLRGRAYARSGFDGARLMRLLRRIAKDWLPWLYLGRMLGR